MQALGHALRAVERERGKDRREELSEQCKGERQAR